ncbi:hypothetical protein ONE63_008486 [Megalurothrips usitatus]|uniref:Uncharacterized protein n=1 Tax=Megalurothrips usitatus TaxID=439358 RepID=A0AAV7XPN6_9NEOP|nr:hypothetical protein ONE63_008486 [Megalurothrips usitatus]
MGEGTQARGGGTKAGARAAARPRLADPAGSASAVLRACCRPPQVRAPAPALLAGPHHRRPRLPRGRGAAPVRRQRVGARRQQQPRLLDGLHRLGLVHRPQPHRQAAQPADRGAGLGRGPRPRRAGGGRRRQRHPPPQLGEEGPHGVRPASVLLHRQHGGGRVGGGGHGGPGVGGGRAARALAAAAALGPHRGHGGLRLARGGAPPQGGARTAR